MQTAFWLVQIVCLICKIPRVFGSDLVKYTLTAAYLNDEIADELC